MKRNIDPIPSFTLSDEIRICTVICYILKIAGAKLHENELYELALTADYIGAIGYISALATSEEKVFISFDKDTKKYALAEKGEKLVNEFHSFVPAVLKDKIKEKILNPKKS